MLANKNSSRKFSLWRKGQWKAKIKLPPIDNFIQQTNEHKHQPLQVECNVTKNKANIKRRAQATEDIAQNVMFIELDHISHAAAINLPLYIETEYIEDRNVPENPTNCAGVLVISQDYKLTA